MSLKVLNKWNRKIEYIQVEFGSSIYEIEYINYTECINIHSIVYLCKSNNIHNSTRRTLNKYEIEYRQIKELLKGVVKNE